jgi:hypothetical protein
MGTRIFLLFAVLTLTISLAAPALAQAPAPAPTTQSANASAQTPAAPAMTAQQSAQAVAGARALVLKVIHTKQDSFPPPSLFTNRSAALIGVLSFIPLAFVDAFASMGTTQEKAKYKRIDLAIKALGKKYNINGDSATPAQKNVIMARLEKQGRPFYADVVATFTKAISEMPSGQASKPSPKDSSPSSQFPRDIAAYTFTPVSPTRVKITAKNEKTPIEARLEEGQWRLDLGGLADLDKMMASNVTATASVDASGSNTTPSMTAPESIFSHRASSTDSPDGADVLSFSDNYQWAVNDTILISRDGATDTGRKMEVWLGDKADYYHILNTDLVAVRTHDKSYPRQDTFGEALQAGDTARVKEFITADPKLVNKKVDTDTPLIKAAFFDQKDVAILLLQHGADLNGTDDFGHTALMEAATFDKLDIAKVLIAAGAKINLKDDNGETALALAKKMRSSDMVAFLKQHGAR